MLVDREEATKSFKKTTSVENDWIYVIGKRGIGKSYFIKNITNQNNTIYCEPDHTFEYWKEFLVKIKSEINDILLNLIRKRIIKNDNIKFANLSEDEKYNILENEVINEINLQKANISKFLGIYLSEKYDYIILDNFFKCDYKTYNWLTILLDNFNKIDECHVVIICDNDSDIRWNCEELKSDLFSRFTRIDIDKYDNSKAYSELISTVVYFDNIEILSRLSEKLYINFQGNAQSILSLIKILSTDNHINDFNDIEKEEIITNKSVHLTTSIIKNATGIAKEILGTLAISPVPLTAKVIKFVLECDPLNFNDSISYCLGSDLIERTYNIDMNITEYKLTQFFSNESYINQLKETQIKYLYHKLYRAYENALLILNDEQVLELAIKSDSKDVNIIASKYFENLDINNINNSYKADLLNAFLSIENQEIPKCFYNMKYVDILYAFGYYKKAYKIICNIKSYESKYNYFMKKGNIEHLILHKNTSKTFEEAANISGITTNQMLSAINRQIMALTQENKDDLQKARKYYKTIINRYSNCECNGLIELYRNSNNIFSYTEALKYTIRGYNLAVKLDNNLEKIKCLHNICMLKVLNGNYYSNLNNVELNIEPDFNMICKEFEKSNKYLHELSYPLLDLGTLEMFKFVKDTEKNKSNLYLAKEYFSRAQIYAKSFYAKNIANTSLLIVNSYLYKDNEEYVISARKRIFDNYIKSEMNIKDFRVHRKILFSLATSASITGHFKEGSDYLKLSKPYVFEEETLRYNNLCDDLHITNEKIEYLISDTSKIREYHTNSKFVPWLISFGH